MTDWAPHGDRDDPAKREAYAVLYEGVQPWMTRGLTEWLKKALSGPGCMTRVEQRLRMPTGGNGAGRFLQEVQNGRPDAIKVIDAALSSIDDADWAEQLARQLSVMLGDSGSAFRVGADAAGRRCLVRRVDDTVQAAADIETSADTRSAHHLRSAWQRVYGITPDPSPAYQDAIRAVESVAKPVVSPKNSKATLGTMAADLRNKPAKWTCTIGTVEQLAELFSTLYRYQADRHGTDDPGAPVAVSLDEAEAALHLSATLTHWFRAGHVMVAQP